MKKIFVYCNLLLILFFSACTMSTPNVRSESKASSSFNGPYLEFSKGGQQFTKLTTDRPRYGADLSSMYPIGFNQSLSPEKMIFLPEKSKMENFRMKKCYGATTYGVNIFPPLWLFGGGCMAREMFNYELFDDNVRNWLSMNHVSLKAFKSEYLKLQTNKNEILYIIQDYRVNANKLLSDYQNRLNKINKEYSENAIDSYINVKVAVKNQQQYTLDLPSFQCRSNCQSQIKDYLEKNKPSIFKQKSKDNLHNLENSTKISLIIENYKLKKSIMYDKYLKKVEKLKKKNTLTYDLTYKPLLKDNELLIDEELPFIKTTIEVVQQEATNRIDKLSLNIKNNLKNLSKNLNKQLIVKLKLDNRNFRDAAKEFNKDLTLYKFKRTDSLMLMDTKNKKLYDLYKDALLSTEEISELSNKAIEIGNVFYYESIKIYNDVNRAYVKKLCRGVNKIDGKNIQNLPHTKKIVFKNCLKGARY